MVQPAGFGLASQARGLSVRRYFWRRLVGFSEMVGSSQPVVSNGSS